MTTVKTYLTEAYAIDNKSILRILTQDKQINKADPNYNYYEKLANWANSGGRQQKLKNVDLNSIELSDRGLITKNKMITEYTTLGHVLLALKNLMDQEGRYNPESELSRLIQLTTLEILGGLSGIKDPKKSDPESDPEPDPEPDPELDPDPKPDPKSGKSRDWTAYRAKKLANAAKENKTTSKVLDEFYDEYYRTEYAGIKPEKEQEILAKLKSLDKILIPEFNKLGYNPEVNPFAQFLKILIEKKPKIFEKLTFNTYGAIHNSFIEKHVTGNMLGNYNEGNILFCEDLYNKNGLDIVEYLDLQKQALDKAETDDKYSNSKNQLIAVLFIQQKPLSDNYEENIEQLLTAENILLPAKDAAKVKSLLEVQELYRYLFKTETKKAVDIKTVVDIVNKAENQNIILDMIKLILAQNEYAGSAQYVKEAQKIDNWLDKRNHTYTKKNIIACREILLKYTLNAAALSLIIKNLVHRINEPTENKN